MRRLAVIMLALNGDSGQGPSGCTANLSLDGDISAMTQLLLETPLVRCDDVAWSLFGLSMAGWNALISLDIIAAALISLRRI